MMIHNRTHSGSWASCYDSMQTAWQTEFYVYWNRDRIKWQIIRLLTVC